MVPSACKLFAGIDAPWVVSRTTHSLAEVLSAAQCEIDSLRRYLPYKDGTPSHDTFGRLFRLVKPEQFEAVLADLARRVAAGSAGQVAMDGKSNEITALPEQLGLLDLSVIEDHPKRGRTTSWP